MKKIVGIMQSENPDIVFNIGDLIDGAAFPYRECFEPLSLLDPGLGSYYVEGNHELYSKDYKKFRLEFPKNLVDLTEKKIVMNGTQIIGLGYRVKESGDEIISRLKSLEYSSDMPSIILLHDPKNIEALSTLGVTLVLSGHTHSGQFFPFTVVVKKLYKKYTHGVAYTNDTISVTSCGVGTSVVPMRIGTTPEIIVLNIK
jgi:predicted MPP superfamily phosphohydrolase